MSRTGCTVSFCSDSIRSGLFALMAGGWFDDFIISCVRLCRVNAVGRLFLFSLHFSSFPLFLGGDPRGAHRRLDAHDDARLGGRRAAPRGRAHLPLAEAQGRGSPKPEADRQRSCPRALHALIANSCHSGTWLANQPLSVATRYSVKILCSSPFKRVMGCYIYIILSIYYNI